MAGVHEVSCQTVPVRLCLRMRKQVSPRVCVLALSNFSAQVESLLLDVTMESFVAEAAVAGYWA